MDSVMKILMVEDIPSDAELILREIKKGGIQFIEHIVETKEAYINALQDFKPDIILSDYAMPSFDGMKALSLGKKLAPSIPFILVTGSMNEETAVEVMKAGADDYIIKEHLTRISTAIKTAIEKQKLIRSRKQTEEKLAWEQYLTKTLIENIPDYIYFKDLESRFIRINKAMADLFRLDDPLKALSKTNNDFFKTKHSQEAFNDEREIIRTGKPLIGKEEMETWFDRSPTWISTTKMPLRDASGNIIGTFGISRDITERKRVEEELVKAKEKAEENDRLKTAFLHNISHEIRTPMNAIVGFSDLLNKPDLTPEKRTYFTDIIIQSSNQLLSIITDIVRIATIEAGQEELHEQEINLNTICKLIYEQFLSIAQSRQVTLHFKTTLTDNEAGIITDDTKLTQVITNLVGNALKFTNQGQVEFGYIVNDNLLEFFTKDTGIGIASEMHEEIFKRFRQVEYTTTRKFGGSGLGLSISKSYVELLGGKMWLTSEPGKGSVFYFTIPYKKIKLHKNPDMQPVTALIMELKKSKTLLIAEDENSSFMVLKELLSGLNLIIIRALNGIEAVEICKSTPVDMVLMDIKMPEMDGYEATKRIKEFMPHIPIIAQTAFAFPIEKERALQAGCDNYITKPLRTVDLITMIKRYLVTG
jgi:PAS domain S-box-containing protein